MKIGCKVKTPMKARMRLWCAPSVNIREATSRYGQKIIEGMFSVKKYAAKYVNGLTKNGLSFEGKVVNACHEYCDKWVLNYEDATEIEMDEISAITVL
jgi:hypothetical protein